MPFSMKVRDVTIVSNCAAAPADLMLVAPDEKLTMATTRPADISANSDTTAPIEFGSIRPIALPSGANGISLPPSTRAPISARL